MPTTIYKRLNDREFIYSRNDLRKIAYWTHEKYIAENEGKDPDRVDQKRTTTSSVFLNIRMNGLKKLTESPTGILTKSAKLAKCILSASNVRAQPKQLD